VLQEFHARYIPNLILAGGVDGKIPILENRFTSNKTTIYVCRNNVCNKPVSSFSEAYEMIVKDDMDQEYTSDYQ